MYSGSETLRWFFKRGDMYDTAHVSIANLTFYCLLNIFGHIYVNVCNVNCSRKSVFHSSYPNCKDFVTTVALSPLCYFAGNNIGLRAPTDIPAGYSWEECYSYSTGLWLWGYIVGLHYTHAKQGLLDDFSFSREKMSQWGWQLKAFGTAVLGLYCFNVCLAIREFLNQNCGTFQLIVVIAVFAPIIIISHCKRPTQSFHFHHYTGAILGMPLIWTPHPYLAFMTGFASGVLVEGTARWGYDPWWVSRKAGAGNKVPAKAKKTSLKTLPLTTASSTSEDAQGPKAVKSNQAWKKLR